MKLLKNYEPFGLNFYTSFFFLFPIVYGYNKSCYSVSLGSLLCLSTSLLNHSYYHWFFNKLDILTVNCCIIYYNIYCFTYTIYYIYTLLCLVVIGISYKYLSYTNNGVIYHSLIIHFISNLGICFLIEGCHKEKCILYLGE